MRKLYLFLCLIALCAVAYASEDPRVLEIRNLYNKIVEQKTSYTTSEVELWGYSAEGGGAIVYKNKQGEIVLIETEFYGELQRSYESFYFHKGKLIFVFQKLYKYNTHIMMDQKAVDEMKKDYPEGDYEVFDPAKTKTYENRFYFYDDKMIRWLDREKKMVDIKSAEFQEREAFYLKLANDLLKDIKESETAN